MNSKPVAIITGASRGIGRAISLALASEGYDIAAVARTSDSECMLSLQPEIEKCGAEFYPVGLDVAHTILHDEAISSILGRYGRIDILVNNAGIAPIERMDLLDLDEETYDRVLSQPPGPGIPRTQGSQGDDMDEGPGEGLQAFNHVCDLIPGIYIFYPCH